MPQKRSSDKHPVSGDEKKYITVALIGGMVKSGDVCRADVEILPSDGIASFGQEAAFPRTNRNKIM